MRVRELAEWLGAAFEGDGEREITGVAPLESAGACEIAFVGSRKAFDQAHSSTAGCLVAPADLPNPAGRAMLRAADARATFARIV
jgi:UDP-3-O-[3-hydroxymyristoyl] glucosamine N-acyltransferase